jgi:cell division protein FtsQ
MWRKLHRLDQVSVVIVAMTLIFALVLSLRAIHVDSLFYSAYHGLRIGVVEIRGAQQAQTLVGVRNAVAQLRGGFMSLDMDVAQQEFEYMVWVRRAQVQRVWPDRIRVTLEEHTPLAAWNGRDTLSVQGVLYPAAPAAHLPKVAAPDGLEYLVARRYADFAALLVPKGWRITHVYLDNRHAWRLTLNRVMDGESLVLDLGQDQGDDTRSGQVDMRLQRFVAFFPAVYQHIDQKNSTAIRHVDMRYPNGFSVRMGVAS